MIARDPHDMTFPELLQEVIKLRDAVKLLGQHNQDDYDLALTRIAELEREAAGHEQTVAGWKQNASGLANKLAERDATIQRVRDVHPRMNNASGEICGSCRDAFGDPVKWPCQTSIALDGDPADDGSRTDG